MIFFGVKTFSARISGSVRSQSQESRNRAEKQEIMVHVYSFHAIHGCRLLSELDFSLF